MSRPFIGIGILFMCLRWFCLGLSFYHGHCFLSMEMLGVDSSIILIKISLVSVFLINLLLTLMNQ